METKINLYIYNNNDKLKVKRCRGRRSRRPENYKYLIIIKGGNLMKNKTKMFIIIILLIILIILIKLTVNEINNKNNNHMPERKWNAKYGAKF